MKGVLSRVFLSRVFNFKILFTVFGSRLRSWWSALASLGEKRQGGDDANVLASSGRRLRHAGIRHTIRHATPVFRGRKGWDWQLRPVSLPGQETTLTSLVSQQGNDRQGGERVN
ncbi:hypothetical protein [Ciceribacter selenitireducens]|uniref:hypothetical protein n=1 Tax=Ciceribacter selenitireducens TaxID=448181 RepID=UPI001E624845|nr:hypothetical protein [Ciceribacter selenitireducens]